MSEWLPSDDIEATNELMDIIKCDDSVGVLAGAGAGKTELLAQKASYLFFTGKCTWPQRILSITFKTEAQINIKERVDKRCGHKATRFDSFTFHGFCKSIVDRFKNVLPEVDRPINNYDIVFQPRLANGIDKILMDDLLLLALLILRTRDDIRKVFASSYAYVFVDEFQDTTNQQYELLQLLFQNTPTKILAVGDINQSIMLWLPDSRPSVFSDFIRGFSAHKKILVRNYRASREIQNVLEVILKFVQNPSDFITPISTAPNNCFLHAFANEYQEASFIVQNINEAINDGTEPSDICVLTKQQSSQYTAILRCELTRAGINNLDMTDLQDALKEPLGQLFTLFLKAIICPEPKIMTEMFKVNLVLNKVEADDEKEEKLTASIVRFLSKKQVLITTGTTVDELLSYIQSFIHELGTQKIKGRWKQYKSLDYFRLIWRTLELHLRSMCDQTSSLEDAVKLFSAENAVHLMNIHKCKGLEYDSVYFMGIEDQAFWNYAKQPFEDNCAIYVALSRAKTRLCITYSKHRGHRINGRYDNTQSTAIAVKPIIKLLRNTCKFSTINHIK